MPDALATQVDVGSLSLASLGAFSTILTALLADDVEPIAMIQLQNLGAAFPVSGPITVKAPDYLKRFNSTRLERLGIIVGWRKGDSASLMAQSTGGQAIALVIGSLLMQSIQEISWQYLLRSFQRTFTPICLSK